MNITKHDFLYTQLVSPGRPLKKEATKSIY